MLTVEQTELMRILRAAHQIAELTKPELPHDFYMRISRTGGNPVIEEDIGSIIRMMDWVIDHCAKTPDTLYEASGSVAEIVGYIRGHAEKMAEYTNSRQIQEPIAIGYIKSVWAFVAAGPLRTKGPQDPNRRGTATRFLTDAIRYVTVAGTNLGPTLVTELGLDENTWPIFVQLLKDGQPYHQARQAANLV